MPKRKKKAGTKTSKESKRKTSISRDTTKNITSPNVSLEQSVGGQYEVVWNDKSPLTDDHQPVTGRSIMMTLQGKEGLVQKREGHQLLELLKSNMKSVHLQHSTDQFNDNELPMRSSKRLQLAEIIRAQNELKELAKRLQYYDDEVEQEEEGSPDLQQHQQPSNSYHHKLTDDHISDVQVTSSVAIATSNSTGTNKGAGVKTQYSDSGAVESDTDTMSCYDDDSSPDHYQPLLNGGVADKNRITGKCVAPKDGGVAETRPIQHGNSDSNKFPQFSDARIVLNDDPELDRIFASVEMNTNDCYNDTKDDEQFWCTAAIELSHQEVGQAHSTPCKPAPPTVKDNHDSSGSDFIDMILMYDNDLDLILNQN